MNSAPTAPPAVTTAEKVAMLGAAFVVGVLLVVPTTRGLAVDSVVSVAHFLTDTVASAVRAVWGLIRSVFA